MTGDLRIRSAVASDTEGLREIRLLALRDEPDAFGSTYEESMKYPSSRWLQMARDWNYFVALDGDVIVGMASGGRFDAFPSARWLYGMFVRDGYRGTGVADELVKAVAAWARSEGVTTLGLHVTTTVARAKAFYVRLGFVPEGTPEPMERNPDLLLQTMTTDLSRNADL